MTKEKSSINWLIRILGASAFASIIAVIALVLQLSSARTDDIASKTQEAYQSIQISQQQTQIALAEEANQLQSEQLTLAAQQSSIDVQFLTPVASDNGNFPQTATAFFSLATQIEATSQAIATRQQEVGATQTAVSPAILFKDDFSDNSNDWNLINNASIANGTLSITTKPKQEIFLTLPNFKIDREDFSIQAKMAMTTNSCGCYSGFGLGFGIGEKDVSYHKFYFSNWVDGLNFRRHGINLFDNGEKLYSRSTSDNIWLWGEYRTIRIDVKSDQITLYHDGKFTIIMQISPHGNDIGFYMRNYENSDLTFSFDDLVVKDIP